MQKMSKYRIYRNPKGISLNGKEFICDDSGHVRLFESEGLAMFWIKKQSSQGWNYLPKRLGEYDTTLCTDKKAEEILDTTIYELLPGILFNKNNHLTN